MKGLLRSIDYQFIIWLQVLFQSPLQKFPVELEKNYFDSLKKFEDYLSANFKKIKNSTSIRLTLALFAILNGHLQ
jgi:hypothetical protein